MKRFIPSLIAFLFYTLTVNSQTMNWTTGLLDPTDSTPFDHYLDQSGSIITVGVFVDSIDFDPGPGTAFQYSDGNNNVFIQKLDPNGNLAWVRSFGGPDDDFVSEIEVDADGSIYLTGYFRDLVDFDPGPGDFLLTPTADRELYVMKLDSNGDFVWAISSTGTSGNRTTPQTIELDRDGNLLVGGEFGGTVDFDPGPGVSTLTPGVAFFENPFLVKYSPGGALLWSLLPGDNGSAGVRDLTVDLDNNILVVGWFLGTIDTDPGPGINNLVSNGTNDYFLQKLDSSGNLIWAQGIGGGFYEFAHDVATDQNRNVIVGGYFSTVVDFDPGPGTDTRTTHGGTDLFVQKFDANGVYQWVVALGSFLDDAITSVSTDAQGNIFAAGHFSEEMDLDAGPDSLIQTANGYNMLVEKLDSNGNLVAVHTITTPYEGFVAPAAMELNDQGVLGIAGHFTDSVDFDPDAGVFMLSNPGVTNSTFVTSWNVQDCFWSPLDLSVNLVGGELMAVQTGATYQWIDCSTATPVSGANGQSFTPLTPGSYAVLVEQNGCSETSDCVPVAVVGSGTGIFERVRLFPNPNQGRFQLDMGTIGGRWEVSIQDYSGKVVYSNPGISSPKTDFALDLPRGIYLLVLRKGVEQHTLRFSIQ